jgi:hypothetical protein
MCDDRQMSNPSANSANLPFSSSSKEYNQLAFIAVRAKKSLLQMATEENYNTHGRCSKL